MGESLLTISCQFMARRSNNHQWASRHSQSQGLVEKGNHLVEMQLQAMKAEWKGQGNPPWSDWLPRIQCNKYVVYACL